MPYGEDGETWELDYRKYEEGMAENRPGHKPFIDYKLPSWAKHPLTHPGSGIAVGCKDYAYGCTDRGSGTALDGIGNHLQNTPSHVAALYGDMMMLESCTPSELNARDVNGKTAAHYAMDAGTSWVVQWLVEKKCDTTSQALLADKNLHDPQDLIYMNTRIHTKEIEWLDLALKGELTDKKSQEAQEYKLKRWRQESLDPIVEEFLDSAATKLQQRMYFYNTGDFQMPYPMPTDGEVRAKMDLPTAKVQRPPTRAKPPLPLCLMFPGNGSQNVGMIRNCLHLPGVQAMLSEAKQILGYDVKNMMLEGPQETLNETKHCQVALFIAGMAALEVMKAGDKKEQVERVQAVAGLSSGEFTALCAAGVLSFAETLKLVRSCAEIMQRAVTARPQSMASVAGLDRSTVEQCCTDVLAMGLDPDPVCQIASSLFVGGFLVSGTKSTVAKLCEVAKSKKALQAKVARPEGFHSALMAPAVDEFAAAIDAFRSRMQPPRCSIYFNANGKRIAAGSDPSTFCDFLKMQLTSEVLWETTIKQMVMDGVKDFYECGPGKQLAAMNKRIDMDAFKRTQNITV